MKRGSAQGAGSNPCAMLLRAGVITEDSVTPLLGIHIAVARASRRLKPCFGFAWFFNDQRDGRFPRNILVYAWGFFLGHCDKPGASMIDSLGVSMSRGGEKRRK